MMRCLTAILLLQLCLATVVQAQRKRAVDMNWDKYVTKVFYDTGKNAELQSLADAAGNTTAFYDVVMQVAQGKNGAYDISGRPVVINDKLKSMLAANGKVHQFVLFGESVLDKKTGKTVLVPLLIGPYDSAYANRDSYIFDRNKQLDCADQLFQPVFFVKYAALKRLLQNYKVKKATKKDPELMTDYLEQGKYYGTFSCIHSAGNARFEQARNGWMKQ